MRKIKFRGFAVPEMVGSQWQYGFGVTELEFSKEYATKTGVKSEWYLFGDSVPIEVQEKSIGQYTGIEDKNGVEIYEGDILKFEDCGEEGYEYKDGFDFTNMATVCFSDGRFELTNFRSDNSAVLEDMHGNDHETFILNFGLAEVVGNIYEHSQLLEEERT